MVDFCWENIWTWFARKIERVRESIESYQVTYHPPSPGQLRLVYEAKKFGNFVPQVCLVTRICILTLSERWCFWVRLLEFGKVLRSDFEETETDLPALRRGHVLDRSSLGNAVKMMGAVQP